jgi:phosphatidylserine decarboxylase
LRLPLTPHGTRELLLFGGGALALGALLWTVHPAAAVVPWLVALFVLSFFRDPERRGAGGPEAALSPADGKVTDVSTVDEPHVIGGPALRIGIFLSVFDVHVNRAPLDGRITSVRYTPGKFLDARHPEAGTANEANLVGFEGPFGPFVVRQVAGLVARRIVFPLSQGQSVQRGQRMGMIKFGSRTELLVPRDAPVEVAVTPGQKVRGGDTILFRYRR